MKKIYLSFVLFSFLSVSIFANNGDVKIFEKKPNQLGLINSTNNKVVLSPKYVEIKPINNGFFVVKNKKGLCGVVSQRGTLVIPESYDNIELFGDNNFQVSKGGKLGIVDISNKQILPIVYTSINPAGEGVYQFSDGKKVGLLTKFGYVLVPASYDSISRLSNCFLVSNDNKSGVLGLDGKVLVPVQYDGITNSQSIEFLAVKQNNKDGLIDINTLTLVVDPIYDSIVLDQIGFLIKSNDKIGFYTKSGKLVRPQYTRVVFEQADLGVAVVKSGDKLAFITAQGYVSPTEYENISRFSDRGIAFVEKAGKLQAVDLTGKELTLQDLTRGRKARP